MTSVKPQGDLIAVICDEHGPLASLTMDDLIALSQQLSCAMNVMEKRRAQELPSNDCPTMGDRIKDALKRNRRQQP